MEQRKKMVFPINNSIRLGRREPQDYGRSSIIPDDVVKMTISRQVESTRNQNIALTRRNPQMNWNGRSQWEESNVFKLVERERRRWVCFCLFIYSNKIITQNEKKQKQNRKRSERCCAAVAMAEAMLKPSFDTTTVNDPTTITFLQLLFSSDNVIISGFCQRILWFVLAHLYQRRTACECVCVCVMICDEIIVCAQAHSPCTAVHVSFQSILSQRPANLLNNNRNNIQNQYGNYYLATMGSHRKFICHSSRIALCLTV